MNILQRNLNRSKFVVWEMKRNVSVVCVCIAPNCCDTEQLSASQPGSVASGTPCILQKKVTKHISIVQLIVCRSTTGVTHCVKRSARFIFSDPFVMQHHNKWLFLRKLISEVVASKYGEKDIFQLIDRAYGGWWFEHTVWWNNRIAGKTKKYLHLYGMIRNWNLSILSPVSCRSANSFMPHRHTIIES